jgi:hypothetical protein
MRRLSVSRLLRPRQRQRLGNDPRAVPFHEPDEREEAFARFVELEAQMAPHPDVLVDGLAECGHRAPPGHGRVSVRNAVRSTLV